MLEEEHDLLNPLYNKGGLEGGSIPVFSTLCRRWQQSLVEDVAAMSGFSFGCCLFALILFFQVFQLCGKHHATRKAAGKVSYQTGGYSGETPISHCMAAEWDR